MKIREKDFENGGEVDIKVGRDNKVINLKGFRASIRKRDGKYEVYKHYFTSENFIVEEILFRNENLKEVVDFSNKHFDMEDVVEER